MSALGHKLPHIAPSENVGMGPVADIITSPT
jgi:hypothetical protein